MGNKQNYVKVSIIMPVYNTAPYLRQCLDSVLAQTLKEFELICVDDGSTDGSTEILEEYARKDSRIITRHQENMGPAIARNNALSIAKGKYVAFMDGDDFYPENSTLENLFNAAEQSGCKIAGGYRLTLKDEDGSIKETANDKVLSYVKEKFPDGGIVKYSELQTDFNYQCYIYSHELLEKNKITFPDYRRFQDPPFFVNAMIAADNIYLIPAPTYVYRWGTRNVTWDLRKKNDLLLGHIDVLNLACDYNLGELYIGVLNRLALRYKDILIDDFSFDSLSIYLLCIEMYTINPPITLTEDQFLPKLNQILTSLENEMIKFFNKKNEIEIISFINEVLDKCTDSKSVKFYCTVSASLLRIISGLKYPTVAMRLNIINHYINNTIDLNSTDNITHPYFNKLQAARNWYHKNLRINQLGEELKNTKTAPPIEEQGTVTVSVIMPVYNTQAYLSEAMDSIVNQTLKDIEIICVNDGSTDGSAEILDEYAKKDSRISIITQENKGLSCSRNAGIMAAKGKYIYFMDSDDVLETTALEELVSLMEAKELEALYFDGESFTEDQELMTPYYQTAYKRSRAYNDVYEGAELLKRFRQENRYTQSPCLQIIKTSFLRENDIYFIPGILYEDNAFTYSVFLNAKKVSHINKAYFHRRLRENSTMTAETKFENVYGRYVCYWDMLKTYYACLPKLGEDTAYYAMISIGRLLSNTQNQYRKLPKDEAGSELGMTDDISVFKTLVVRGAKANTYKERLDNCKKNRNALKEKNNKLKEKLENNKQKNSTLKEKLKVQKDKDNKLKEKLESSKMKNEKLQAKLDAYKQENQTLKKKLRNEKKKNRIIQNSTSYKIGRAITYIPRRIKRFFKKQ